MAIGAHQTRAEGLFERVLVPTDGSAAAERATETALELAHVHGATVEALYVVDTAEHWDMVVERREREGEAAVEAVEERGAELGVTVEKRFRYGDPSEEILDYADAAGVDLVVLGTERRTGVDRLVHPSRVVKRVAREAAPPVLVVGDEE